MLRVMGALRRGMLIACGALALLPATLLAAAPQALDDAINLPRGMVATVLTSGATSVLVNDSDADLDPLTVILVNAPLHGLLTLNPNGTFSYSHDNSATTSDSFTYRAFDGSQQSNLATVAITITATCVPLTLAPCSSVPVAPAIGFALDFNSTGSGLAGTGFGLALPPSVNRYPVTPSIPSVPGYEPALLAVTGGQLQITATRGSLLQTQTEGTGNNTQVNALGIGVALTQPVVARVQLVNPAFPDASNGENAGLWFGLNEDNYVRLVLTNRAGVGAGDIELRREINGVTSGAAANTRLAGVNNVNTATFTLELRLNPLSNEVSGRYTSTTGETGVLGPLAVPASFFAGQLLPDGSTGPVSYLGVLASNRFNAGSALTFAFDNFAITGIGAAPVAVADAITVARGGSQAVLDSGATSVLANDSDAEGDPLTAVLVSGPANGSLALNANGTFSYTHNNSATSSDSFTYRVSDGLQFSNTVTVSISVFFACTPYTTTTCDTIPVVPALGFALDFNGAAGGLSGTGFGLALPPSVNRYPVTPSIPSVPGYEPALLAVTGGQLQITATRGSLLQTQVEGTGNNTQVNALGIGVALTQPVVARVQLVNPAFPDTSNGENAGLWFGLNEDNYVRLVLTNRTGVGAGDIELRREIAGVTSGASTNTRLASVNNVNTATVTLELRLNPLSNQVSARYTSTTGETGVIGPLSVPASFFAGQLLPDGSTGPVAYLGLLTSNRNNTGVPLTFAFDNFAITGIGAAPVAVTDAITVARGTASTVLDSGATSVLANDSDAESDPLTAVLVSGPAHGSLTLNANGIFSYTHNNSATSSDSFTYRANDGQQDSNTVTVSISIFTPCTPLALAPCSTVPVGLPYALDFNAPAAGLAGTGFTLVQTRSVLSSPTTTSVPALPGYEPNNLALTGGQLVITATRGTFNNTSNNQVNGLAVGVAVTHPLMAQVDVVNAPFPTSNLSEQAGLWFGLNEDNQVRLSVNNRDGAGNGVIELRSEIAGASTATSVNVSNVNSSTATLQLIVDPTTNQVSAAYTIDGISGTLGPVTVPPSFTAGQLLPDAVTGPVSHIGVFASSRNNGALPALQFAFDNFRVASLNMAPAAIADALTVAEGGTATTLTGGATSVLANDTDPENNALTAALVTGPANGALTLNPNGTFSYTHNGSETSSDSFTYRASDGTSNSNPATVSITVTPVNDAPVAAGDSYSVNEDTTLTVTVANRITLNDTDAEGSTLTAILVTGPGHGALTLNADGTFSYIPTADYNGPDSFTYRASDGSAQSNVATVTITINPVGDAPVGSADAYSLLAGATLTINAPGLLANDLDVDGDPLSVLAIFQQPLHGTLSFNANGSFTYIHDSSAATSDSFVYVLADTDPATPNANVSVTLTIGQPPLATADALTVAEGAAATTLTGGATSVLANDSDPEGQSLTATLVTGPANGTLTLNANGSFSYVHNGSETTSDSFSYRASDGTANSNVATVTITVTPVNDAPVAVADSYSVNEDTTLTVTAASRITLNDSDAEGSTLTAILVTGPAHGALTLNADGTFTYVPTANYNGADSFSYRANDGAADSNIATVALTINPVGDPPTGVADAYSVARGATLTIAAPGLLANDSDIDGDALSVLSIFQQPGHGTLSFNANGAFSYVHDGSTAPTSDSFVYVLADTDPATPNVNVTVTLTISFVNSVPVAVADALTVAEGAAATTLTGGATSVLANDTDPDPGTLTAILVTGPTNGTLTLNANGTFSYMHNGSETTSDSFSYQASDGVATSNTVGVTITITPVNDAPLNQLPPAQSTGRDTDLIFASASGNRVVVSDVDAGSDDLQINLTAVNGVLSLGGTVGLAFSSGDGTADPSMVFSGPLAAINTALDGLRFAPTAGFVGAGALQLRSDDLGHSGSGGALVDTDSVVINVVAGAPAVLRVGSSSADGGYGIGSSVQLVLTFDQPVTVTGGVPTLRLETGSTDRDATYTGVSGAQLSFQYMVLAGDNSPDLDYLSAAALALNGATIRNSGGLDAVISLPAPGSANSIAGQHALLIDGIAPTVQSVSVPANGHYVAGQTLQFEVLYSEPVVIAGGVPSIAVQLDSGAAATAQYISGSGSSALLLRYTVAPADRDQTGIVLAPAIALAGASLRDLRGNDADLTLAAIAPTVGILIGPAPAGEPVPVPVDSRWMLLLMLLGMVVVAARASRRP